MKLWQGLGYYSRARNLKKAAGQVMERYGGALPASYEELLTLAGVGEYTAGAIASIAFGIPVPAVDGNVLRVVARIAGDEGDITLPATKKRMGQALQEIIPTAMPGAFNQAMMELGPPCACPTARLCATGARRRASAPPWPRTKSTPSRQGPQEGAACGGADGVPHFP